jgi:thiamine biosynthesis lipoprotein ApbE
MTPTRRDFLGLGVGALAVASLPRALRRKERVVRRRIPVMGTIAEVAVRHRDEAWAQRGIDAAFDRLRHVDRTMSRFRADSDVGRLNAAGPRGGARLEHRE